MLWWKDAIDKMYKVVLIATCKITVAVVIHFQPSPPPLLNSPVSNTHVIDSREMMMNQHMKGECNFAFKAHCTYIFHGENQLLIQNTLSTFQGENPPPAPVSLELEKVISPETLIITELTIGVQR